MAKKSFEQALTELEKTVESLEQGDLSLDDSLKQFEQGVKLARFLREELNQAEKKIEILLKKQEGEIQAEDFELEKEGEPEVPSGEEDPDNSSSLF